MSWLLPFSFSQAEYSPLEDISFFMSLLSSRNFTISPLQSKAAIGLLPSALRFSHRAMARSAFFSPVSRRRIHFSVIFVSPWAPHTYMSPTWPLRYFMNSSVIYALSFIH